MKTKKIAILPGDGIGKEIVPEAVRVLRALEKHGAHFEFLEAPIGGAGVDAADDPLPPATLELARYSDAILFGAAGAPQYEHLPRSKRAGSGLLRLRKSLGLFANFRPVQLFPELMQASTLKPEVIKGLNLMILRELNSDIYFGEPRGFVHPEGADRVCINTMRYSESEIERIAHLGFQLARKRSRKLCSVDKANVLETMAFWREVVTRIGRDYPDVELSHMYVDAAAMELIRKPTQFDVIVTSNMFGDILSDQAAMLTGSIGMLPSASLGDGPRGLYEPIHGSAPAIAGKNIANPLATILSAALMLRLSLDMPEHADRVESAVRKVLSDGLRTADIFEPGSRVVGTIEMGSAVAGEI
jgi:3-isopropylmalate dehydrogenase